MGNIARVRVELKKKFNDPERNYEALLREFRQRVNHRGIMHDYKDHEYYESKSEKKRRKKKEATKKFELESIESKLEAGEKVKAPPALIKKILANKDKRDYRDQED